MVKSMLAALVVIAILMFAFSGSAAAQANCAIQTQYCATCGDPSLGYFNCLAEAPFLSVCSVKTAACVPSGANQETRCKCGAGQPISLADGNTYIEQADVNIPGLSGGLSIVRTWNSIWPSTQTSSEIGLFGPNWRSNFEERIFLGSDNYIKYARGDGSFWSFGFSGATWAVAAPANVSATLAPGNAYWTLTFQNGQQRLFDNTSGNLISIIDRNGNATQLSYDAVDRLTTVTDPVSRHLYFTYAGDSSYLVTGVSSDVGLSLSYSYDSQGRLTQVTEPDASTLSFAYDSNSLISAVTDSSGKILESHTYDSSGRGLTSSRANGVDAVSLSYSSQ